MALDKGYIKDRMLMIVGSQTIGGSTDDTKRARLLDTIYDGIVYETFHMNVNWHFATTRTQLDELSTTPAFGWDHQFAYPQGCVRIIKTVDENARTINYPYKREVVLTVVNGRTKQINVLLTDQVEVFVQYVYLRKDPASWPGWFQELVILKGAKALVGPVKKDDFTMLNIKNDLANAILKAKGANGAENMQTNRNAQTIDMGDRDFVDAAVGLNTVSALGGPFLERD
ncbi:MAG: hypothetical protein V3W44_04280 [Dehalococcoidales bacterium]